MSNTLSKNIAQLLRDIANKLDKQETIKASTQKVIRVEKTKSEKEVAYENFQKSEKIYYKLEAENKKSEAKKYHNDVVMQNYYIWKSI